MASLSPRQLKFIDEAGVNVAMTRRYGRPPTGAHVIDAVPQTYGPHITRLVALGLDGIEAVMTGDGATDTEVFLADLKCVLAPTWRPGDIVVMDHLPGRRPGVLDP